MTKSDLKSRADDFSTVSKELAKDLPVLWTTAMNSGFIMNKKSLDSPTSPRIRSSRFRWASSP